MSSTASPVGSGPQSGPGELENRSDVRGVIHQLNNQLAVILAHAELIEAKAADPAERARATQVVAATLQAMSLAREIRSTLAAPDQARS